MRFLTDFDVQNCSEEEIRKSFVGRIDYVGEVKGGIVESLYFLSREEYVEELKESINIGRTIQYEDYKGYTSLEEIGYL
ncbi:hypothetical protein MUO14_15115 [Halobacillus shinanisalinarum]|uniref:Uncharacterized protein n=1 Tax=Halobacillus shinanisalinarum TaxID=2932258 RepID=A0ABY4GVB7_9BACI|nr:hypothetical protein [Halobacillus shinanisalinarum]UOQ91845.1 hypothetical protein MUO14_15115 [Halobacillus shinanisalinarum]